MDKKSKMKIWGGLWIHLPCIHQSATETVQSHLVFLKKWSSVDYLASKEQSGLQCFIMVH